VQLLLRLLPIAGAEFGHADERTEGNSSEPHARHTSSFANIRARAGGIPHSVDSPIGLPLVELPVKFRVLWAVQPVNALFSVLRLMSVKLGTRSGGRS
jgi:hypothetical protein